MENEKTELTPEENNTPETPVFDAGNEPYVPRPAWQVWAARIGLVIFLFVLFVYYYTLFSGGGK